MAGPSIGRVRPRGPRLAAVASALPWRAYLALTKPRVVLLMLFTAWVGMWLARPRHPDPGTVLAGLLGIGLMAASAAAINHVVDRHVDARMARTRRRPLPSGQLGAVQVMMFALLLGLGGWAVLWWGTNPLCAVLTLASLVGYAGLYSLYLKQATPQNIVIGGAAGAAPPLLGWVAVTGQVEPGAWLLFLIIFIWTPPHFWALAIDRRDDYARAGVPMLPVTHGVAYTARRVLGYALALVPVSLLPVALGMGGWLYLAGAVLLGLRFVAMAWRLQRDLRVALPLFRYSIGYLFGLFVLLLVEATWAS
ncbi:MULTISPECIES: heme o synthase [Caldimonas]|jgi:protoheme IX farnesyltransferase|uniref:heme o synthase n=1 Tax=Caldimonas TaxID=196013 RepID=UPI00036C50C5|nr:MULTISPECIES: heme o synthase [Caldimonas]MCX7660947.1 heme o synthase [Caldimonas manganoxidans]GIX22986.1 MAG: protoheme IX farnesyltransferase [Caldimonas sp.]